jgi:hypothetical protein
MMKDGDGVSTPSKSGTDWLKQQSQRAATATPSEPACDPMDAEDAKTEAWLKSYGVKYAPKAQLPLGLIDEKRSRQNQARATAVVPESVDRFRIALKAGKYLGAIVVYQDGNRAIIVDGNNREEAHRKENAQFIWAFVIDPNTPSAVIDRLTVSANLRHGVTPDPKYRIKQAHYLVTAHGLSIDVAAGDAGVSPTQVRNFQATLRADARAKDLKISGFDTLASTARQDLGRITNDPVFLAAGRCALETKMTADDVKLFVRDVKAFRSEGEQLAYIGEVQAKRKIEQDAAKTHGRTTGRIASPQHSLATSIGKIMAIDVNSLARSVLTDLDRQEIIKRTTLVGERLIEIQIALEAASKEAHRDAS